METLEPKIAFRMHESLGQRVKRRRKELRMTQIDLSQAAGMNQGYLSEIERDRRRPSKSTLNALAVALDLPEAVLVGAGDGVAHDNPQPLEVRHLPMLGTIPAGPPAQSQEQMQLFPVLRHMWTPDHYCLRLTFDSMEPTLKPGDIVLVHYRPDVDPLLVQGRICACLVDGEPTLKRVSVDLRDGEQVVVLRGDNPNFKPQIIDSGEDLTIQGVVTTLVSRDL
jgi:SOS-response transcriptional repressor LexA